MSPSPFDEAGNDADQITMQNSSMHVTRLTKKLKLTITDDGNTSPSNIIYAFLQTCFTKTYFTTISLNHYQEWQEAKCWWENGLLPEVQCLLSDHQIIPFQAHSVWLGLQGNVYNRPPRYPGHPSVKASECLSRKYRMCNQSAAFAEPRGSLKIH